MIIAFLNGDPDRPLIIGNAYNANNSEPYSLPSNSQINGLKTQLLHSQKSHQLSFNDTPSQEKLTLHSEGNINTTVLNNYTHTIEGKETITISGDHIIQILTGNAKLTAKELHLSAGGSQVILDMNGITIKDNIG